MAQAFYGNRTVTYIRKENVDRFILGYMDDSLTITEKIDRTIVRIPDAENIAVIYNKYEEAERLLDKEEYYKRDGYVLEPLVTIPEENIEIYSRCIVCRMNEAGELESLQETDCEKFIHYLAE